MLYDSLTQSPSFKHCLPYEFKKMDVSEAGSASAFRQRNAQLCDPLEQTFEIGTLEQIMITVVKGK